MGTTLDYRGFPHLFRLVLENSTFKDSFRLRQLSTATLAEVDAYHCRVLCIGQTFPEFCTGLPLLPHSTEYRPPRIGVVAADGKIMTRVPCLKNGGTQQQKQQRVRFAIQSTRFLAILHGLDHEVVRSGVLKDLSPTATLSIEHDCPQTSLKELVLPSVAHLKFVSPGFCTCKTNVRHSSPKLTIVPPWSERPLPAILTSLFQSHVKNLAIQLHCGAGPVTAILDILKKSKRHGYLSIEVGSRLRMAPALCAQWSKAFGAPVAAYKIRTTYRFVEAFPVSREL